MFLRGVGLSLIGCSSLCVLREQIIIAATPPVRFHVNDIMYLSQLLFTFWCCGIAVFSHVRLMGRCFSACVLRPVRATRNCGGFLCACCTCLHNAKAKYKPDGLGFSFLDRRLGRPPCIELLGGLFVIVVFSPSMASALASLRGGAPGRYPTP